ncbi:MAG: hypothetical protein ACI8TQ_000713 [Planctomycetota bacterium]|jgi:hypothetical protein
MSSPESKPTSIWKRLRTALIVIMIAIQFIPVDRNNPPVEAPLVADAAVMEVLKRACYDCHSNETVWPWYSYVAPASFLVAHDVEEAREHMNFSDWESRDEEWQAHHREEVWEEVEEGEMPLWFYTPLHSEADLSEADMEILRKWAE